MEETVCIAYNPVHQEAVVGTGFDTHAPPGTEDAGVLCPLCGEYPSNRWRLDRMHETREQNADLMQLRKSHPDLFRHVPTDKLRGVFATIVGLAVQEIVDKSIDKLVTKESQSK